MKRIAINIRPTFTHIKVGLELRNKIPRNRFVKLGYHTLSVKAPKVTRYVWALGSILKAGSFLALSAQEYLKIVMNTHFPGSTNQIFSCAKRRDLKKSG